MLDGRRKEERQRVMQHVGLIAEAIGGKNLTMYAAARYVQFGVMPDGSDREMPDDPPEVQEKIREIEREGKLIVR